MLRVIDCRTLQLEQDALQENTDPSSSLAKELESTFNSFEDRVRPGLVIRIPPCDWSCD